MKKMENEGSKTGIYRGLKTKLRTTTEEAREQLCDEKCKDSNSKTCSKRLDMTMYRKRRNNYLLNSGKKVEVRLETSSVEYWDAK